MISVVGMDASEYRGLSTDEKPTKYVGNGAVFFEIDTSEVYMFDKQNGVWYKLGDSAQSNN